MGFQGRSQIKALYGEESECSFSAPFTKLLLHTGEPEGGEWASKMLGDQAVEKIIEHLSAEGKRTYTTQPVPTASHRSLSPSWRVSKTALVLALRGLHRETQTRHSAGAS